MTPLRYEIRQMLRKHPDEQGYIIARALDTTPGYVSKVRKEVVKGMNNLNYASREASQRLVDVGIVLDTDYMWFEHENKDWILVSSDCVSIKAFKDGHTYPAPSMAEVWRELPYGSWTHKSSDKYEAWFDQKCFQSTNPTDALIDLLIWVRKEASDGLAAKNR